MADSTTATTAAKVQPKHNPAVHVILGIISLVAWIGASLFQIQTTEAWFLGGNPPGTGVSWGVINQFGQLFSGQLSGSMGKAIIIGWGVEILTVVIGVAFEAAKYGVYKSGQQMLSIFVALSFGILAFNFWTDANYGTSAQGMWGQALFAAVMAVIVVYFLPIGIEQFVRARNAR